MCTVIVCHRCDSDYPLIVGANRNEFVDRPADPPSFFDDGPLRVFAPQDLRAGGTWLGVNAEGVFAALVNRFQGPNDPDRASRGELVFSALKYGGAKAAGEAIAELSADRYNPFHLIVADPTHLSITVSDGERLTTSAVAPGLFVITERSFGAADAPRKTRARQLCRERLDETGTLSSEALRELLSDCRPSGSLEAVCVDMPEMNYSTRSSSILRYGAGSSDFLYTDGPPCETDYEDLSDDLSTLFS